MQILGFVIAFSINTEVETEETMLSLFISSSMSLLVPEILPFCNQRQQWSISFLKDCSFLT